jgi:hypothetical protein
MQVLHPVCDGRFLYSQFLLKFLRREIDGRDFVAPHDLIEIPCDRYTELRKASPCTPPSLPSLGYTRHSVRLPA